MQFTNAITAFSLLTAAQCTSVLIPLYIWPGSAASKGANWEPLRQSIAAHPSVEFKLIINPLSGPNGAAPDVDYQAGLDLISRTTYPNVEYIGYVWTGKEVKRDVPTINADTDEWASWPTQYRPTGIFFDDAERGERAGTWDILRDVAAHVRTQGLNGLIVNNMGTRPTNDTGYNLGADQTIIFENSNAALPASQTEIDNVSPSIKRSQLSLLVYSDPSSNYPAQVKEYVGRGFGSIYFTDSAAWSEFGAGLEAFAAAVDSAA